MYMTEADKRREFIENQRFMALADQDYAEHRDSILRARRKARQWGRGQSVLTVLAIVLFAISLLGRLLN